jgi:hypothetical protein
VRPDDEQGAAWIDPAVLYAATAVAGAHVATLTGGGTVHHHAVGNVVLPSGRLVAYDPTHWDLEPQQPFAQPVAPGAHPVELRVVQPADGDARTLCAVIQFGAGEPERWEQALLAGEHSAQLRAGEAFAYPVDSGTGCFCDPRAASELLKMVDEWTDDDRAALALHQAMAETYVDTWEWANMTLEGGVNVVAFSTGVGDGAYPVWLGYRAGSSLPVVALNDFGLLAGATAAPPGPEPPTR